MQNRAMPGYNNNNNQWQQDGQRDPMTPQHHKYRTKPCRYFNMPTGCKNGDNCTFLHTIVGPDYVFDQPPRGGGMPFRPNNGGYNGNMNPNMMMGGGQQAWAS